MIWQLPWKWQTIPYSVKVTCFWPQWLWKLSTIISFRSIESYTAFWNLPLQYGEVETFLVAIASIYVCICMFIYRYTIYIFMYICLIYIHMGRRIQILIFCAIQTVRQAPTSSKIFPHLLNQDVTARPRPILQYHVLSSLGESWGRFRFLCIKCSAVLICCWHPKACTCAYRASTHHQMATFGAHGYQYQRECAFVRFGWYDGILLPDAFPAFSGTQPLYNLGCWKNLGNSKIPCRAKHGMGVTI